MAEERLPLLRGRITSVDTYQAPQPGGDSRQRLPSLDPHAHRINLLQQLDAIHAQVSARSEAARDVLAAREIVALHPAAGAALAPDQLDHSADAWLVGIVPETGAVVLDVANPDLDYLRKKIDAFGDDSKVSLKTKHDGSPKLDANGNQIVSRAAENAVGPIQTIRLASLEDLSGRPFARQQLVTGQAYWFEIACRGGYRRPLELTENSRTQLARQLHQMGACSNLDEFLGPEKVYFFVRLTEQQLSALRAATDCIYEVDLAAPAIRDIKLADTITSLDLKVFSLQKPPSDAPAVVIMDTGIATEHPLLKAALLPAAVASPEIPSAEDTHGHGTQMAGLALYNDLGAAIEHGAAIAPHWVQSCRILVRPHAGTAAAQNDEKWPKLTVDAVKAAEEADPGARDRVFALAVTRSMQEAPFDGPAPTLWSHAVDQVAFHHGRGRLVVVSAGNARESQWQALAEQYPQLQLSEKIHEPAQAANALTVGAYTERVTLPNDDDYREYRVVASHGGISPFTSAGPAGRNWPIKPDVVMEGGNLAISDNLYDSGVGTLSALTTHRRQISGRPLTTLNMTSEATARAAYLAARIWSLEPKLRPETVRALIVHSASWTSAMMQQFKGLQDRLQACGFGVPDESVASQCAQGVATVIIEDAMPNAVREEELKAVPPKRPTTKATESKERRKVKLYRLPLPATLLDNSDPDVELRVTLSYFAEPNKFGRTVFNGLDLKWDMQGPHESEDQFLQRINILKRAKGVDGKPLKIPSTKSFDWTLKTQARSRGTIHSDRWRGKMSALVGDKLIAVVPVLGWWAQRRHLKEQDMRFALVISVFGPGVYAAIKPRVEAEALVPIEV